MHMFWLCFALLWLIISTYGFLWINFNLISCSNKDTGPNTHVLMQMSMFCLCAWNLWQFLSLTLWYYTTGCWFIYPAVAVQNECRGYSWKKSICCTEWFMINGSNQTVKLPVCCVPISLSKIISHETCTCFGCALLWFWIIISTYGFVWWI